MRPTPGEIEHLIGELNCDQTIRCQKARRALVDMGRVVVTYLVKALSSKKPWVRWEAAKALSEIGDPAATEALVAALEDREFDVRWLAAEGLVNIGEAALVPLLKVVVVRPASIWLREGIHHVLSDMERGNLDDILLPIIRALDGFEPDVEVPIAAKAALDALTARRPEHHHLEI